MNDEIVADAKSKVDPAQTRDKQPIERAQVSQGESLAAANALRIVIAATFTADLLQHPLNYWMESLDVSAETILTPYSQVIQELLNPESLTSQNKSGFNILLIRLEDWIRDRPAESVEQNLAHVGSVAHDFVTALRVSRTRTSAPMLVYFGPSFYFQPVTYARSLEDIQSELMIQLDSLYGVHCWTHADLVRLYPIVVHEDAQADRIGHIPYTNEYFVAIATLLARRISALVKPKYKVIAIDCDNTLWKGVCGEDGAAGVELTPAHSEFQKMLVRQHDAGVLLCLCSKNNWNDVEAVFKTRPEMPLREDHLICSRVNWNSKSSNLQSLSQELGLSLDSFILVDDSPLECAEVQTHCPSVLTLQLPETPEGIAHFIDHVWAFDRVELTEEAKQRTAQYKQNRARHNAREEATNLEQFLASLELSVDVSAMQSGQLARVAELIQRTNQFNLTTIRRTPGEIDALWSSGEIQSLVVNVRDRFGDYGLVGALFFRREPSTLVIDTFVLSCRVLGRGVEHRIVNELGRIARRDGLAKIVLRYRKTLRNTPAWTFLERSFRQFRALGDGQSAAEGVFTVPSEYAENLRNESLVGKGDNAEVTATTPASEAQSMPSNKWHETAFRLSRLSDIVQEINRSASKRRPGTHTEYVAPRTPTELAVAGIWAEVLGLEEVSVCADFLDLGGDSVLAVQAIARLASVLGADLSVYEFFEGPTVEKVAGRLASASESSSPIERTDRTRPVPLSWAQQRLWFIDRLEGSAAYHIPLAVRLRGELDRTALQAALDTLLERHEALRTVFTEVDGEPMQKIVLEAQFALEQVDLSGLGAEERGAEVPRQSHDELAAPFDLSAGPLIRGRLLQSSEDEHVLLITMHHIVSDGWSIGVLIRELGALYEAYVAGQPDPLPPLTIQYADYTQWQRQWLTVMELHGQLTYWKEHLQGAPELLELPTDRPRPPVQSYRGANVRVWLEPELTEDLKVLSRRFNLTLAMTLYTAWSIVLARLSGQEDIVAGMPVANRRRTELEGLVGLFVNTLAVRVRLEDNPSVTDLLQRVKEIMLGAYAHQDVPFEQVVEALQPARSLSHSPVFQVMFVLHNAPRGALQFPGLTLVEQEVPLHTAQFDLTLSLRESEGGLSGSLNYASDLFDASTIERWVACFEIVLRGIVRDPQLKVSRLPLMSDKERGHVIESFNATNAAYPRDKLIHELFEEQVERTPHAVAVVCAGQHLTYRQLNSRANRLARYLRKQGVGPDSFVGLCVERSLEMVVGLLSILKAGGAYVPLDPTYPQQRLEFILKDTAPKAVLTQDRLKDRVTPAVAVIALDSQWSEIAQERATNLTLEAPGGSSSNLAYVIYTSGSTGQPKGVAIEHRNAVNLMCWAHSAMSWEAFEQTLHSTSLNFDLSVYECFVPLTTGGSIRVVQNALALLNEPAGVTLINTVPSAVKAILDSGSIAETMRVVNLAGEPLKRELVDRIFACSAVERVCNLYGPSETTTYSTWVSMSRQDGFIASIGRPITNTQVYILDRDGQVVPIGVVGEMYIGGAGVARGYLNRPELTAERFLPDPFCADPQARMYKTGDLGRWRTDGTIEFLGRNDHQVKIRGFRIELGEIEAQLARHGQVKEAVVIAREDVLGEKRLVAYVTHRDQGRPSVEELRAHLKGVLPEHMVPSAFVILERTPLTPSGKLDRRALPAPELEAYSSRQYEAPQGKVEEILSGIWQALLRVERVGRQDNFFELGGHSLLIVQMMERLRRVGLSAELRRVFESPTLANLASALASEAFEQFEVPPNLIPSDCEAITPQMLPLVELEVEHIERIAQSVPGGIANVQDIYPLVPLQEGILFHHLFDEEGGDAYVLAFALSLSSRERLGELIAALQAVIDRHDVLRTAVLWEELPRPVQVVYRQAILPVKEIALDPDREPTEQIKEWIKPERQRLDIRHAPLIRLQVAANANSLQWYALLQFHHVTIDHVTLEIVISEVVAHLEGRAQTLPESVPYRNHVAQSLAYARTHDAEAFFRSKLGEVDEPTAPFGLVDVHGDGTQIEEACEEFELALAQRVRTQARRLGVSAATLFHAAWGLGVARTSGRDDVVFGSVLLGRLHGSAGAQRILGMFINTLPLRLQLQGLTATELVEHTQRELVELLGHEQASLAAAQRCSGVAGSAPLFSALFNYRHSVSKPEAYWSGAGGVRVLAIQERTNYPITLSVDDLGEGFSLSAQTDRRVDPHRITAYLHTAVQSLVEALEQAPQTPALALPILPESERRQVIELFNATQAAYPQEKLIHELFEEQVQRTPNAVAVLHGGQSLTYAELNGKANQLARYLSDKGVGPDRLVGICVERSLGMVIGMLGILKAGGAYVPLDPNYPVERLQYMLEDAAPQVVLTQKELKAVLPATKAEVVELDEKLQEITGYVEQNLPAAELELSGPNLVYVIYTSGSTGRPKGTAMPHRSMLNLIEWHRQNLPISEAQRVLQFAALSFDVAFQETFSTLCSGGTLMLLDEWVRRDPRALLELLSSQSIDRLFVPPLMLQSLSECFKSTDASPRGLKDVITAGEQLRISPEIVNFFKHLDGCRLHNHYGPTETHVVTALTLAGNPEEWPALPTIGQPIANTQIYVLDGRRQPVPIGVVGEIHISGANVARGYLNRPELTAERFVPDPFSTEQARLYKTGDLGRWRPDGTIEYLGRNDDQVKVRGYRIELGEIEAELARHPQIRDAAVVAREDDPGEKRLVAYVAQRDQSGPSVEELRAHLKGVLPEYMVPSAFVILESLPLTPSGKLDRRALPAPQIEAYASWQYEPPQGEVEESLAQIWQELLHVEQVGRGDNFFDLGGHSLLAVQVIARIQSSFSIEVSVRSIFAFPTLKQLSEQINELRRARLLDKIAAGGTEMEELLEKVASMPECNVQELVGELTMGGRP